MLTLATGNTVAAKAGTSSAITYTLFGDEVGTGDTFKVLAQGQLATGAATVYTVPASTSTLLKSMHLVNTTASPVTGVTFYVNGTAGTNQVSNGFTIPASGSASYADGTWRVYGSDGILLSTVGGAAGGDLTGSYPNPSIAASAVSLAKMANVASSSFLGRLTAGSGSPEVLTGTQATTLLDPATTALKGLMSAADKTRSDNWCDKAFWNVLDHGISTANSAATNDAAWTALMSAITDNANVWFPPSSSAYQFSATMAIPSGKHLTVLGAGAEKSIIQTTHATNNVITCGDWYQTFNGLKFTASVTRTAGAAILSGNNVAINVFNCDFDAQWDGIVYTGGASAGNLAVVDNVSMTNVLNRGIVLDGQNANTYMSHITINSSFTYAAGIEINQCGSLLLSDSDLIRSTNNLKINPTLAYPAGVFSVYCTNVFFDSSPGSSVKLMGIGAIQRLKFVNCWFSGSATGFEMASTASTLPTAIDLVNCDIFSNSSIGILANGVQDFALNNCRIAGNATAGVRTNASAGAVTKFNIQNCVVGPTAGPGANGIGIDIVAGTYGGYNITGNDVRGNTSNLNLQDAGTVATSDLKIIGGNIGHLLKGALTATLAPTSSTTETLVMSARIPANSVSVGQMFRLTLIGNSSSTGTLAVKGKAGANGTTADTAGWTPATSAAQVANHRADIVAYARVVSIGSSGTVAIEGRLVASAVTLEATVGAPANVTVNTQNPWFLDITIACSAGVFTPIVGTIEAL